MSLVVRSVVNAESDSGPAVPPLILALCLLPGILLGWMDWRHYPHDLFTSRHQLVVRDYLNIWAGGHLATHGSISTIFQPDAYVRWLRSLFGPGLDLHVWGYPPHVLLVAIPFSYLPLVLGFLAWIVATSAVLWIALRAGGLPAAYAWAVVLSPAALGNALDGQNGALTAAALAGGLLLTGRRPLAAGALLGLLTMKPQLALLVPVCLLAAREWRTTCATLLFSLAYCGAGVVAFGWDAWRMYFTHTAPFMRSFIDAPFGMAAHFMMVPPFITMRAAGASLSWAYGVQIALALAFACWTGWVWSRPRCDRRAAVALTLCLAPLTTPYAHAYDLVSVSAACALIVKIGAESRGLHMAERLMLVPAWIWPGSALAIGVGFLPGLAPFCIGLATIVAARLLTPRAAAWPEMFEEPMAPFTSGRTQDPSASLPTPR